MKNYRWLLILFAVVSLFMLTSHSGKTDSYGGHHVTATGEYHYHCGGHPAHQHPNGVCPYSVSYNYNSGSTSGDSSQSTSNSKSDDWKYGGYSYKYDGKTSASTSKSQTAQKKQIQYWYIAPAIISSILLIIAICKRNFVIVTLFLSLSWFCSSHALSTITEYSDYYFRMFLCPIGIVVWSIPTGAFTHNMTAYSYYTARNKIINETFFIKYHVISYSILSIAITHISNNFYKFTVYAAEYIVIIFIYTIINIILSVVLASKIDKHKSRPKSINKR